MTTRLNRFLILALFSAASLLWPASSSAQVLEACRLDATLAPIGVGDATVQGTASYTCANEKLLMSVAGCLLLDGAPVSCDGQTTQNSSSASVDLSFPCFPGVWSIAAIGSGAERQFPGADFEGPVIVTDCDPLRP